MDKLAGLWSGAWEFTTRLDKVILVSPVNSSTQQPNDMTFIWNKVNGADSYQLVLSLDSTFSNIYKQVDANDVKTDVPGLDYLTTYYFKVKVRYSGKTILLNSYIFEDNVVK